MAVDSIKTFLCAVVHTHEGHKALISNHSNGFIWDIEVMLLFYCYL